MQVALLDRKLEAWTSEVFPEEEFREVETGVSRPGFPQVPKGPIPSYANPAERIWRHVTRVLQRTDARRERAVSNVQSCETLSGRADLPRQNEDKEKPPWSRTCEGGA